MIGAYMYYIYAIYIYIYIYTHAYAHNIYIYMYVHIIYMYTHIYIYIYAHNMCIYTYINIYIYRDICTYIYIYMNVSVWYWQVRLSSPSAGWLKYIYINAILNVYDIALMYYICIYAILNVYYSPRVIYYIKSCLNTFMLNPLYQIAFKYVYIRYLCIKSRYLYTLNRSIYIKSCLKLYRTTSNSA